MKQITNLFGEISPSLDMVNFRNLKLKMLSQSSRISVIQLSIDLLILLAMVTVPPNQGVPLKYSYK